MALARSSTGVHRRTVSASDEEAAMKARVGDRLVIKGHRVHEPDRDAEILEVRGPDGEPPYRIRWSDSGRDTLIFPGSDALIEQLEHRPVPSIERLGQAARDESGAPTLTTGEATALLRRHIDLEKIRTTDYDTELWELWRDEVGRAAPADDNAEILDRVLERVRESE
jgi:hypothetical protein